MPVNFFSSNFAANNIVVEITWCYNKKGYKMTPEIKQIIAQAIGIVAMVICIASFQFKKMREQSARAQ